MSDKNKEIITQVEEVKSTKEDKSQEPKFTQADMDALAGKIKTTEKAKTNAALAEKLTLEDKVANLMRESDERKLDEANAKQTSIDSKRNLLVEEVSKTFKKDHVQDVISMLSNLELENMDRSEIVNIVKEKATKLSSLTVSSIDTSSIDTKVLNSETKVEKTDEVVKKESEKKPLKFFLNGLELTEEAYQKLAAPLKLMVKIT